MREAWVRLCGTYQSKGGLVANREVRKVGILLRKGTSLPSSLFRDYTTIRLAQSGRASEKGSSGRDFPVHSTYPPAHLINGHVRLRGCTRPCRGRRRWADRGGFWTSDPPSIFYSLHPKQSKCNCHFFARCSPSGSNAPCSWLTHPLPPLATGAQRNCGTLLCDTPAPWTAGEPARRHDFGNVWRRTTHCSTCSPCPRACPSYFDSGIGLMVWTNCILCLYFSYPHTASRGVIPGRVLPEPENFFGSGARAFFSACVSEIRAKCQQIVCSWMDPPLCNRFDSADEKKNLVMPLATLFTRHESQTGY